MAELSQLFHSIQQIYENRSLNQARRNRELSKIIDSSIKKKPEFQSLRPEIISMVEAVVEKTS